MTHAVAGYHKVIRAVVAVETRSAGVASRLGEFYIGRHEYFRRFEHCGRSYNHRAKIRPPAYGGTPLDLLSRLLLRFIQSHRRQTLVPELVEQSGR